MNECGSGSRKAETLARAAASEDQALRHLGARRYDASIRCFTAAIRLDYGNAEYHLGRALAYACRGDFPMAVGDFTTAISVDPGNAAAYRGSTRDGGNSHICSQSLFRSGISASAQLMSLLTYTNGICSATSDF